MGSDIHYITVSRAGVLMARRKGSAPVRVATAAQGFEVTPDDEARARGVPSPLRVFFAHGGGNKQLYITTIATAQGSMDIKSFQERFAVTDEALGRWVRGAIERALDSAAAGSGTSGP